MMEVVMVEIVMVLVMIEVAMVVVRVMMEIGRASCRERV